MHQPKNKTTFNRIYNGKKVIDFITLKKQGNSKM